MLLISRYFFCYFFFDISLKKRIDSQVRDGNVSSISQSISFVISLFISCTHQFTFLPPLISSSSISNSPLLSRIYIYFFQLYILISYFDLFSQHAYSNVISYTHLLLVQESIDLYHPPSSITFTSQSCFSQHSFTTSHLYLQLAYLCLDLHFSIFRRFEFFFVYDKVGPNTIGQTKTKNKNAFSFLILLSPTKRDEKCRQKQKRVFEKLFLSKTRSQKPKTSIRELIRR